MSSTDFVGPVLAFLAVLALIPAALWLLKRTPIGAAAGSAGMRVVGTLPLSAHQRLVTVEVGAGDDRRWLVLGVSGAGIQTLHAMPPQALPDAPAAGFAQLLKRQQAGTPGAVDGR